MASTYDGIAGSEGLETVFHEAMHRWDNAMIPPARARFPVTVPTPIRSGRAACRGTHNSNQYWLPYLRGEGTLAPL